MVLKMGQLNKELSSINGGEDQVSKNQEDKKRSDGGGPGCVHSAALLRNYFGWRHWKLQFKTLEERPHPQRRCKKCNIQVIHPWL